MGRLLPGARGTSGRERLQAHLEVPAMVRLLGLPAGGRVLEVGCGRGNALRPLVQALRPTRLVGLDLDGGFLAAAKAPPGVELVGGDVRDLPFADAAFDLVLDFGTLYHVDEPVLALREIARVLAPGGLFVHETRVAQLLAHPARTPKGRISWQSAPQLRPDRSALLWARRQRVA